MQVQGIRSLFSFPGYVLDSVKMTPQVSEVKLRRDGRYKAACPDCRLSLHVHRRYTRVVRDLALGIAKWVLLHVPVIQGYCARCNAYVTLLPEGMHPSAQATWRFKQYVSMLAKHMPLSAVEEIAGVASATAYRWDKEVLERTLPSPKLDGLKYLLVDEKSVRRGHGYVTLVMNGENGELLHMAPGKKKESLEAFFEQLNKGQKDSVKAVAMDRAGSYYEVVREQVPKADIVFDKFHIIAQYHRILDELRRQEWRKASAEDKRFIKGQRFNLFRTHGTHDGEQMISLLSLLMHNDNLLKAYYLKDALYPVWSYRYRAWARRYLEHWIRWAHETGIPLLQQFGRSIEKAKEEIVNYCKHKITTGPLEGFNNTVSRLIHRACGIRNLDYLFLKLRQISLKSVQQT